MPESSIARGDVANDPASRVVVTGLGVISSIGHGRQLFWNNLIAGHSGIGPVTAFDTSKFTVHRGAEVRNFQPSDYLVRIRPQDIDRASQFAIAAARLALQDADLSIQDIELDESGVVVGTTSGEPRVIEQFDDQYLAGRWHALGKFVFNYPCSSLAAHVATELGLGGDVITIPTACAAGNHAIAYAFDGRRSVRSQLMLAGRSESFSRITYTGFGRLGAIAPELC